MVTKPVGRKAVLDDKGRKRSDLAPSGRGFTSITLKDDPVGAKLLAYMKRHGITKKSAAVEHMLNRLEPAKE